MKLEQKVTNLEISKRLKELGVKQDGYFMWWLSGGDKNGDYHTYLSVATKRKKHVCNDWASAFTCAELGEMLPLAINGVSLSIFREKGLESWDVAYGTSDKQNIWQQADNLADAMAKMLIYLIENGLCPSPSKT